MAAVTDPAAPSPEVLGLDHAGIVVPDLNQAVEFYVRAFDVEVVGWEDETDADADALGLPGEHVRLRGALLRAGGCLLEVHQYLTPTGQTSRRVCDTGIGHLAFAVSDIDAAYTRLQDEGVSFNTEPRSIIYGFYAGRRWVYGQDPWGTVIELCQHPENQKGHL